MTLDRFQAITDLFWRKKIVVAGDFCLDRYLEIDPTKQEVSIETHLPVHNVVNVRSQPGGAGTILNNLAALGIGEILPVGFCGEDGEGFELRRALADRPGVRPEFLLSTSERRTFTYCKPLVLQPGKPPCELNRFDSKNWSPTPDGVQEKLCAALRVAAATADAIILLDQVDVAETGVVTRRLLAEVARLRRERPHLLVIADSRRGLREFPPVVFKMNAAELNSLEGGAAGPGVEQAQAAALALARRHGQPVFVTLAERGMVGAAPDGRVEHARALPVRGAIDIVGAGDAVTANLAAALAAGADSRESLDLANAAASVVIHQLGTTGTASVPQLRELVT